MIYVMSDIHGNLKRFDSIMKQINLQPEDTLYILGDIIDRYEHGIKILKKVMSMPNVKVLMGNHEYMMLTAIGHCKDAKEEKTKANWHDMRVWYSNGGNTTHHQLKKQTKATRAEIFEYIRNLPINIDIELNGKKYKLIHAAPIENFTHSLNARYYRDQQEFAVWERWTPYIDETPEYCTIIFGHTPTVYFQNEPSRIFHYFDTIGIDCGAGYEWGRLACLRLDDMKEFYSEEE